LDIGAIAVRRTPFCLGVVLVALLAGAAAEQVQAQRPVVPRRELKGRDFRPDGAWRRRALRVRATRAALLRVGQLSALNQAPRTAAATTALSGTFKVPTLLIRPSNVAAPFPSSNYQQTLFGTLPPNGKPYTVSTYYQQLSNGYLTLTGSVLGWYTAPQTNTYYEDGCNGIGVSNSCPHGGLRLGELFLSALTAANAAGIDWGQFDNDGADGVPNSGDDDGYVDFVAFIHPDVDGACGNNPHIWSHRYVLSAITGAGQPFTTSTPALNGGFIKVDDYIVGSGVGGSTACTAGRIMPIGTFAHETGHAFGLPDLYDTDGQTAGIGIWGLMSAGNYTSPESPSRMEAWSLSQLGWIDVQPLAQGSTVIAPIVQSHTAYVIPITTSSRDEYFLLENRQRLQADTALLGALYGLGPGVLVWHVDNDQIAAHSITADNRVNAGPIHGLELVQADGLRQLDLSSGGNVGDGGDPFPGFASRVRLSALTTPRAADNEGGFVGFMLDRFQPQTGGGAASIEVRYTVRPSSVITTNRTDVVLTIAGISTTRFDDILVPGDPVQVSAPTIASLSPDGRQRIAFERWSNGQPAAFSLLPSGAAPDTLTATYDQQFRVRVQYVGTGSVESSLSGVLTGAFRPDTAAVTLRVVPAVGSTFEGWSGDTTATDSVLVLSGAKPFDLTASFSVSPAVIAIVDAAKALMGGLPLASPVSVALDRAGNRNGAYDLGDFLAYLDRNHATLSPALLQKLLASERPPPSARGSTGR
jgi:M6 family metalloprotease-like protein